ncbi:MAG TPA: polysaccharide deacetylase family protein [Bacteroidia bacterium]|nr:polysaccharide deacetylase family protein [Bacteroidia bacterium]
MPQGKKIVYLTFDDGPNEKATTHVLDVLKSFHLQATFFCLGSNIQKNPALFDRMLEEGHMIGNHSMHHPNGWNTEDSKYVEEFEAFEKIHAGSLFRPPYGRIKKSQIKNIIKTHRIIMWDVLSYDFDIRVQKEQCLNFVTQNVRDGSILLFHDSVKAFDNMRFALPRSIEHCLQQGYSFELLRNENF